MKGTNTMSKKKEVVINYHGLRLLLGTVGGYCGIYLSDRHSNMTTYGIRFELRTGERVEQLGNDEVSRDKVLKFLDNHFKPLYFSGNLCQVCVHKEDNRNRDCYSKHDGCNDYNGYKSFEREKDKCQRTKQHSEQKE